MNIISLENVSSVYGEGTPFRIEALKNVSVGFEKGKVTGLIGHTGSGKSTLVQMLNGLMRPDSGKVLLDGVDIWEKPKEIQKVRYRVGLVMQYPEYQLFAETVEEDIAYAPKNMGLSDEEVAERVREAAKMTAITEEMLKKSPFDLSGGQKRRAAIAGILAMRPEVLVLDEPAAGLDPRGRSEILGGLLQYRDAFDATIVLVSHSMEDMATYCENIVVMNRGEVFKTGTVEEIFHHAEELDRVGLDIPQVAHIALDLRRRGIALEGSLYTVKGVKQALLRHMKGRDR